MLIALCNRSVGKTFGTSVRVTMRNLQTDSGASCDLPDQQTCRAVWRCADAVCFDVDSTVIMEEGIDQLAAHCGKNELIKKLTAEAMKGGVDFRDALRQRLEILRPDMSTVRNFVNERPPPFSPGIRELVEMLHARSTDVYLVSGGFKSLIAPVARGLGIPLENIYANRLKFFFDGDYGGFDESQPTSRSGGKADVVRLLKAKQGYSNLVMVGDGATDLEACPPADGFIGYGGNVVRENVKERATWYVTHFRELREELLKEEE